MLKRTTIELDSELLARAKRALGEPTTRGAVERALRQAAERAESDRAARAAQQLRYFERLASHADLSVLGSEDMWR
jgi:Arc/MetJ family transcription regulator